MSYDRHRLYSEACRIDWRGKVFRYSPEFATQIMLARSAMQPDGPFPALTDTVECVVGTEILTLNRDEVDELLELALRASVAAMKIVNQAKPKGADDGAQ